jgi:ribosomal protein S12 methylthiotransferase
MLGMAEKDGHEITADASQADVLVVNTCAFIDRAKQESIDTILEMAELKKQAAGPQARRHRLPRRAISRGTEKRDPGDRCRLRHRRSRGTLALHEGNREPEPGTAKALPFYTKPPVFGVDLPTYIYDADTPRKRVTPKHYAYVKIAEGCDYKCAFCIIPKMRGHYRSRPIDSIVQEARQLAAQGVKELLLISQDSTFYGIDRGERGALPTLLRALNDVAGIEWIRLLYLYPTTITSDVIDAIADLDKVVKYIDLPLQHASDPVLKRMKRPGTRKSYVRLLENIRARIPNVALRTTFIVGFPGETADDFAALESFIEEIGFDHVGVFTYSHEEGTSAHALEDDVPAATKKKRQNRLMARQRNLVAARQQARLGERTRLVIDGPSPEHELVVQGRLAGQAPEIDPVVYLTDCDPSTLAKGAFIDVEIVGSQEYDLVARPI